MIEERTNIEDIDVTLFRSKRAKRINITVKPFTGVRVSVPETVSFEKAKAIVGQRKTWIKKNLARMKEAEELFTVFDWKTQFRTREHELRLIRSQGSLPKAMVRDGVIKVDIPQELDILDTQVQFEIRRGIEIAWRKEAKALLPKRVKDLAHKHGLQYNQVFIKNTRTRWGSCSSDNNINLSLHLMRLTDDLVDYVILHELVHTRIKNHGSEFWQLLDQVTGGARKLDREVKENKIQIY